jgi:hypothetical protein
MLTRRRAERQRGQVLTLALVMLALVLFPLMGLVADLVVVQNESTRAAAASFMGATAGGQSVSVAPGAGMGSLRRTGQLRVAPGAESACQRAAAIVDHGARVTCRPRGAQIAVHVTKRVQLPVALFGFAWTVGADASGGPALGTLQQR